MTYRGNPLAAKLDKLAINPAAFSRAPNFARGAVLTGRCCAALLLALTLGATATFVMGYPLGYTLLIIATPLATAGALISPLQQASGDYRPDERERSMHVRAVLWGTGSTLVLALFAMFQLAWNTLAGGWVPVGTIDFIALAMVLIALPTNIAALAAWLMTSTAGAELELDQHA